MPKLWIQDTPGGILPIRVYGRRRTEHGIRQPYHELRQNERGNIRKPERRFSGHPADRNGYRCACRLPMPEEHGIPHRGFCHGDRFDKYFIRIPRRRISPVREFPDSITWPRPHCL